MKSGLTTLFLICLLLPAAHANASEIVLLDSVGTRASERASTQSFVVRQRTAILDVDSLYGRQDVESIKLRLFDDTEVTTTRVKARKTSTGSFLYSGKLAGVEGGQIILVAVNRNVYASIYLPVKSGARDDRIIYQIRPEDQRVGGALSKGTKVSSSSPVHVIREIHYSWKTTGGAPDNEGKILELVNLERAADGIPILQYDDKLTSAARGHAQDMAQYDYCSHNRRDGSQFWQSIRATGYASSKVAENVAAGISTPEEAFESLMASPTHRANIINAQFTQIGVAHAASRTGVYHNFWAQEFGAGTQKERPSMLSAAEPNRLAFGF